MAIEKFDGYIIDTYDLNLPEFLPLPHVNTRLISKNYKGEWEFEPILMFFPHGGYQNDMIMVYDYEVKKLEWTDDSFQKFCHWWLTGEDYYDGHDEMYFNLLATLGEIEEGKYLVRINY